MVDWLRAQRGGLDAVLGSGGSGMSAGQAQLMAFARVHILVLENARVAEAGERVKLAADPESRFSRLLRFALEEMLA